MASEDKIRVALIGYGFVGKLMHAPYISSVPGIELRIIATTSNPDEVRSLYPSVQVCADYDQACTHGDVDLVVVATPNLTHFRLCELALRAKKHVVCDKPFTQTVEEAMQLHAIATEHGKLISVFQNRRWDSELLAVREAIEAGKLGDVLVVESRIDRFRLNPVDRWREHAIPCSGTWWDLGPHLVDQSLILFGTPKKVKLSLAKQRSGAVADDAAHAVLDYGRLQVFLNMSNSIRTKLAPRMTVHGTKSSMQILSIDVQEKHLIDGKLPGSEGFGQPEEPATFYDEDGTVSKVAAPVGNHCTYYAMVRDAILGKGPNPVSLADQITLMKILTTAEAECRNAQERQY